MLLIEQQAMETLNMKLTKSNVSTFYQLYIKIYEQMHFFLELEAFVKQWIRHLGAETRCTR